MLPLYLVNFFVDVMLFWILLVVVLNFFHLLFLLFSSSLRKLAYLFSNWLILWLIFYWRIFRNNYRKLAWVRFEPWTQDHWIPFRCSNRLSYQAMSSTLTQSQLCTVTPISSVCLQCFISGSALFSLVSKYWDLENVEKFPRKHETQ